MKVELHTTSHSGSGSFMRHYIHNSSLIVHYYHWWNNYICFIDRSGNDLETWINLEMDIFDMQFSYIYFTQFHCGI